MLAPGYRTGSQPSNHLSVWISQLGDSCTRFQEGRRRTENGAYLIVNMAVAFFVAEQQRAQKTHARQQANVQKPD
jgi:hypothetical protein